MKLQIKKLTCCECSREFANMTELGNHIRDDHGMNTHVYYDKSNSLYRTNINKYTNKVDTSL